MNVVVLAAASREGGALTIFKQFLEHLPEYIDSDKYYIFKDGSVETPNIDGVEYINDSNHSFKHRIYFDSKGLVQWCINRGIAPDLVISFQNSGAKIDCRQLIYYHQSLPFYPEKWNPLKGDERSLFFYKNIYPMFVKRTLNKNMDVVVQTESLRGMFAKCYNLDINNTHALFPDVAKIDIENIDNKCMSSDLYHFLYPSNSAKYKRHKTLIDAVALLRNQGFEKWDKIRIYFTFSSAANPQITEQIHKANLNAQFVFLGQIPYQELLTYYKAADCLLFPSTIETIGLPMLEAASFSLPIIATNRAFAQDVLKGYLGATFIDSFNPTLWAEEMKKCCVVKQQRFAPLLQKESSWLKFFDLIHKK